MVPLTPSNFHFFYDKWTKHLNKLQDKNQKNIYASKIAKELWTFSNDKPNNTLEPCISKLSHKMSHKTITAKLIIDVLNKIQAEDNKLTLS